MFCSVYKTTCKNLLRSMTFWLTFTVLCVITARAFMNYVVQAQSAGPGNIHVDLGIELPVIQGMSVDSYRNLFNNVLVADLLMYAAPIFGVITTVLTLNRDHGDKFFEIEKAAGIKPFSYTAGRIAALLTVNGVILLLLSGFLAYGRIALEGGVDGMSFGYMLIHSLPRLLMVNLLLGLPCLFFYIGMSYAVGSLFGHGIPSMVTGCGYVMFYYVVFMLFRHRLAPDYFSYYAPVPRALRSVLDAYCYGDPAVYMRSSGYDLWDALHGLTFLLLFGAVCCGIAFLRTKKRTV